LEEPGLGDAIQAGLHDGTLTFTSDLAAALADSQLVWVAFDTPVDDQDEANIGWLRQQLDLALPFVKPGTVVLVSSQVPVGFTASLERQWGVRGLRFAVAPENLRLGKALDCFRNQERIVVGCRDREVREVLSQLLQPFCTNIIWMSIESAEMTKHALNAFLATSVAFINELARLCEAVGADAKEVERGLKSEPRIGPAAYLSPGAAFAGGTLARDVRFLINESGQRQVPVPLLQGLWDSNSMHKDWVKQKVAEALHGAKDQPVVAILGLTYKPGTNTLRRSASVELCRWLRGQNVVVRGHDPAVAEVTRDLEGIVQLSDSPAAALVGADVAVVATQWPQFKELSPELFVRLMRQPWVIDQTRFLAQGVGNDSRIHYQATGCTGAKPQAA
jgi:UDPglucose 6-dehydrogenase